MSEQSQKCSDIMEFWSDIIFTEIMLSVIIVIIHEMQAEELTHACCVLLKCFLFKTLTLKQEYRGDCPLGIFACVS